MFCINEHYVYVFSPIYIIRCNAWTFILKSLFIHWKKINISDLLRNIYICYFWFYLYLVHLFVRRFTVNCFSSDWEWIWRKRTKKNLDTGTAINLFEILKMSFLMKLCCNIPFTEYSSIHIKCCWYVAYGMEMKRIDIWQKLGTHQIRKFCSFHTEFKWFKPTSLRK